MGSSFTKNGVSPSCIALPQGPWATVFEFLTQRFPHIGANEWLERMAHGEVLNDHGQAVNAKTAYAPYQKIHYYRHMVQEPRIPFDEVVLYQDEHLVVADKPHFLPVTPAGRYVQETLLVRLKRKLGLPQLAPIHRLDRDTAGVVVFSVNAAERHYYHALFRERCVQKKYEAIASWQPVLAWPMTFSCRMRESAFFMQMTQVSGEANSETHIDLLETRGELARYLLCPTTGQKHQLRLHMALLNRPILGDRIYPVLQPQEVTPDYSQPLRLLAKSIEFVCPLTQQKHAFLSQKVLLF
jgi:tRNA pseudouridine32 synthase / 23S rRNA pseudouridine746 synthase